MNSMNFFFVLILLLTLFEINYSLKCLDEDGREVDWWMFYKIPRIIKTKSAGYTYVYLTSNSIKVKQDWIFSEKSIQSNDSLVAKTLNQIYLNSQMFNYVQYNDEFPPSLKKSKNTYSAHSKGVIAFDSNEGFWLSHSVPKFPPPLNQYYEYPLTALRFGQNGLCFSFDSETKSSLILDQLLISRPSVYAHNFIDSTVQNEWSKLINKEWSKKNSQVIKLSSLDGQEFVNFIKSPSYYIEIYDEKIAPEYNQSLYVETWREGSGGHETSNCSYKYHILNVEKLSLNAIDKNQVIAEDNLYIENLSKGLFDLTFDTLKKAIKISKSTDHTFSWKYSADHSKWAISTSKENPVVCSADLNRVQSQKKRGGGAFCLTNLKLWTVFSKLVNKFEPCV